MKNKLGENFFLRKKKFSPKPFQGKRDYRQNSAGLAMVEIITALFVITVGLFGVIQMYHVGLGKMKALHESALAAAVAQNEIETLRALPYDELRFGEALPFRGETPELDDLANAEARVSIASYGDGSLALKEVTVSVRWSGEHGRTIEKRLTTLIGAAGRETP